MYALETLEASRSPFLESAENFSVPKMPNACFGKATFLHVFKLTKRNMSVKFDDLNAPQKEL